MSSPPGVGAAAPPSGGRLGTFGGVFSPSLLTILGLVLFLRLGFVTGNVGLGKMLLILALSTSVSLLTTISLAAIATNLRVGGGGVYFLISRTLGPAWGGAIGIVLYVAMSVSVAFYAIGLGEAVTSVLGSDNPNMPRIVAVFTIVGLLGLAWLGADIATRLQFVVLGCLVVAIVAYFAGVYNELDPGMISDNFGTPIGGDSFWVSFAIFFPAITGFTQGVAMSGDLKTPSRSISVGTFSAIGVSTVVYVIVIFTFAMTTPLAELRADTAIMRRLSLAPWLIDVGVIAATLSSAIASMMGAPRTLQRLAADRLVKPLEPFAIGAGPDDNPRRGAMLSAAIALVTVALGDLDVVAPIISMFFLASYGMINYATYAEARAASTSFRPRFRLFDWRLSLAGTIACLGVILAIDPVAGALAGVATLALYRYLRGSVEQVHWADSTRGFRASEVRTSLQLMGARSDDGRDWRPYTVAFVPRDPARRARLTEVASWLEGGAGFTTVARIVTGRGPVARKQAGRVDLELQRELAASEHSLFGRVIVDETLESGVGAMLQAHGIGALRPNIALFSWYDFHDPARLTAGNYATMVQTGIRFGCNVGIVHTSVSAWHRIPSNGSEPATISVWWADDQNGQLLTMLAWMCTRDSIWNKAKIDVWLGLDIDPESAAAAAEVERVTTLLDDARIPVQIRGTARPDAFAATVEPAGLVFAPVRIRQGEALGPGDVPIDDLIETLPTVVFTHAATTVELDVQPDDVESATVAIARDRANELRTRSDELSEAAGKLLVDAEMVRLNYDDVNAEPVIAAAKAAEKAQRAYLDARARADEASRLAREIDPEAGVGILDPELWIEAPTTDSERLR